VVPAHHGRAVRATDLFALPRVVLCAVLGPRCTHLFPGSERRERPVDVVRRSQRVDPELLPLPELFGAGARAPLDEPGLERARRQCSQQFIKRCPKPATSVAQVLAIPLAHWQHSRADVRIRFIPSVHEFVHDPIFIVRHLKTII